jgi:hypothetical protein
MTDVQEPRSGNEDTRYDYDSWTLDDQIFPWLVDTNGQ